MLQLQRWRIPPPSAQHLDQVVVDPPQPCWLQSPPEPHGPGRRRSPPQRPPISAFAHRRSNKRSEHGGAPGISQRLQWRVASHRTTQMQHPLRISSWVTPGKAGLTAVPKPRNDAGYRLAEVVGVDANFNPPGECIKWRYVLMRTLNSTQIWGWTCLTSLKILQFYGQHDLGDTT
jgi:hypothetical protein